KGLHVPISWNDVDNSIAYSYQVNLNGSKNLSFLPLAGETKVKLTSTWDAPSFTGEFVPHNRKITNEGFSAEWGILSLNTSFPQQWNTEQYSLKESEFGVSLFQPVNLYQKTTRSAKYAILIIFLTFLTFFIIENLGKLQLHPIQYGMVGLGLIIFYTLLLSLSEYILFQWAYLISAAMIVLIIGGYSITVFNSIKRGGLVGAFTALLYLFIYIIIQSEDYSLLIGSFGLYIVLAAAMYFSRKINWYKYKVPTVTKEVS
ncbi:MAG: cell envelope integrity protein CreD, partial [Cyclobacteriaceae bacterium]